MEKPRKLCLPCSWQEFLDPVGSVSLLVKSENLTCIRVIWYQPLGQIMLYSQKEDNHNDETRNPHKISQTLGAVPGWLAGLPDSQLEHQWALTAWFLSDSKLTARDKALVAFGAAAAGRCQYWTPFHTEQLRLSGIGDDQLQEASYAALQSAGFSAYLHGIGYSLSRWLEELSGAVEYIKSRSG